MFSRIFLLLILVENLCSWAQADDAIDVLTKCKTVFRVNREGDLDLCLERRDGTWQITGMDLTADDLRDSDLEKLSKLTALSDLGLYGSNEHVSKGFRYLARLPSLRRFRTPWVLTAENLHDISMMVHLKELILGGYRRGELKEEDLLALKDLEHLVDLRRLDLSHTGLTDASMAQISSLKNLEELNLGRNKITDVGIARLKDLQNLCSFELDSLGSDGVLVLKELPHLEHLGLHSCNFEPGKANLSVLKNLKSLSLGYLNGESRGQIGVPAKLQRLEADYETFCSLNLQSLQNIENMTVRLNHPLGGDKKVLSFKWLNSLPKLRELTLDNSIESDVLAIAELTGLRALNVTTDSTCLPTIGNEGMRALVRLTNLKTLRIADYYDGGNSKLVETNAGMDVLPKMKNVETLELRGFPAITNESLANIWEMKQLRSLTLDLAGDIIIDKSFDDALARVKDLTELEEFTLSCEYRIKVSDEGLKNMESLKKLRVLDLTDCHGYTDAGLARLMDSLPNLQTLRISYQSEPKNNKN
jgi:hypothetical protein